MGNFSVSIPLWWISRQAWHSWGCSHGQCRPQSSSKGFGFAGSPKHFQWCSGSSSTSCRRACSDHRPWQRCKEHCSCTCRNAWEMCLQCLWCWRTCRKASKLGRSLSSSSDDLQCRCAKTPGFDRHRFFFGRLSANGFGCGFGVEEGRRQERKHVDMYCQTWSRRPWQIGISHFYQWIYWKAKGSDDPAQVSLECGAHLGEVCWSLFSGSICSGCFHVMGCTCHWGLWDYGSTCNKCHLPGYDQEVRSWHATLAEKSRNHGHECGTITFAHYVWWWSRCFKNFWTSSSFNLGCWWWSVGCRCCIYMGTWTSVVQQLWAIGDFGGVYRCLCESRWCHYHWCPTSYLQVLHLGSRNTRLETWWRAWCSFRGWHWFGPWISGRRREDQGQIHWITWYWPGLQHRGSCSSWWIWPNPLPWSSGLAGEGAWNSNWARSIGAGHHGVVHCEALRGPGWEGFQTVLNKKLSIINMHENTAKHLFHLICFAWSKKQFFHILETFDDIWSFEAKSSQAGSFFEYALNEARVLDNGQRLVLLASGEDLSEADLKVKAASLGRGYILSQVKIVDNDAWKFNTSGKLLRNIVPLEEEVEVQKDGWEAFDKTGVSDLELDIASCLAPQVNVDWNRDSHFMEDLGVDSGGFGRLISQMRSKSSLQKIDLQMLFEHPTVRSLAACLSEQTVESDEECDDVPLEKTLLDSFLQVVEKHPHAICFESNYQSLSYLQVHRQMLAYQRLLHQAKASKGSVVAIYLDSIEKMGAMLGILREGCAFSLLGSDFAEELKVLKPDFILARADDKNWSQLTEMCAAASSASQAPILVDVSLANSLLLQPPKTRRATQGGDVCCVALQAHGGVQSAVPASHNTMMQTLAAWLPHISATRISAVSRGGSAADFLSIWSILAAGATLVLYDEELPQVRTELLICEHDSIPGRLARQTKLLQLPAEGGFMAIPEMPKQFARAGSAESFRSRALRSSSLLSLASSLAPYVVGQSKEKDEKSFGKHSWPVLCGAVQGFAIFGQPVFVAARLLLAERVMLPLAFILPLWQIFLLLVVVLTLEQFLRVFTLVCVKWVLIGRYKEGDHDIYSLFYLRHWLVEHMAKGTIVGQNAHQGSSIAFLFLRNLALRALGADVRLTSVVTARVVAYDLVSVGDLATVHGPRHLTAVNYGTRRMVLKAVKVGAGAYVGPNCTLEPGCEIAAAGYVEPLSTVPSGMLVDSRVSGVPAQVVAPKDLSRLPEAADVRSFRTRAAWLATGYWTLLLPKAVMPFLGVIAFQLLSSYPWDKQEEVQEKSTYPEQPDVLPILLMDQLPWIPLIAFGVSMLNTVLSSDLFFSVRMSSVLRVLCRGLLASNQRVMSNESSRNTRSMDWL